MDTKQNTIHVIMTGGPIDSFYCGVKDTVRPNKDSVTPDFITGLKLPQA